MADVNEDQIRRLISAIDGIRSTLGWIGAWVFIIALNSCGHHS